MRIGDLLTGIWSPTDPRCFFPFQFVDPDDATFREFPLGLTFDQFYELVFRAKSLRVQGSVSFGGAPAEAFDFIVPVRDNEHDVICDSKDGGVVGYTDDNGGEVVLDFSYLAWGPPVTEAGGGVGILGPRGVTRRSRLFYPILAIGIIENESTLGAVNPSGEFWAFNPSTASAFEMTMFGNEIPMFEDVSLPTTGTCDVSIYERLEYRDRAGNNPVWKQFTGAQMIRPAPSGGVLSY